MFESLDIATHSIEYSVTIEVQMSDQHVGLPRRAHVGIL